MGLSNRFGVESVKPRLEGHDAVDGDRIEHQLYVCHHHPGISSDWAKVHDALVAGHGLYALDVG